MSIKYCDQHKDCERQRLYRRFCAALVAVILLLLLVVLVVWLVLRPSKPRFYLNDVTVVCVNVTASSYLTVTLQASLAARNPNDRVGILYRRLDVFVAYRDEPVTVPVSLPPQYQGHRDVSVWSPVLSAEAVPVAPYVADSMRQDVALGYVALQVRVDGRLRWKVGSWLSGSYHLFVSCPAVLSAGYPGIAGGFNGTVSALKFTQPTGCSVEV